MNAQPKSKLLVLIIGILLIANIVLLSFFLMNNPSKEKRAKSNRKNYISEYLEKELGFDSVQLLTYDSLSKKHRELVRTGLNNISSKRKEIFKELAVATFNDSALSNAASQIHELQKPFELNMFRHLKDIRQICTKEQQFRFDTGFYKIFGRRREGRKEN